MGQYFEWVNYDKREIIMTDPWPNGQKLRQCAYIGCPETDAALTMLAGDWAGDLVVFLGDNARFKDETHPGRREVERRLGGVISDDYTYDFTDICGRFDYVRDHPKIRHFVEYDDGSYDMVPYDGPYDVEIHQFRYAVNESKKEYVDRYRTAVRYIDKDTGEIVRYDPFPELMCSETGGLEDPGHEIEGLWFGDIVRPTDEHPGDDYTAVAQDYSYWAPASITATDEEVRRVIFEYCLDIADEDILQQIDVHLS